MGWFQFVRPEARSCGLRPPSHENRGHQDLPWQPFPPLCIGQLCFFPRRHGTGAGVHDEQLRWWPPTACSEILVSLTHPSCYNLGRCH